MRSIRNTPRPRRDTTVPRTRKTSPQPRARRMRRQRTAREREGREERAEREGDTRRGRHTRSLLGDATAQKRKTSPQLVGQGATREIAGGGERKGTEDTMSLNLRRDTTAQRKSLWEFGRKERGTARTEGGIRERERDTERRKGSINPRKEGTTAPSLKSQLLVETQGRGNKKTRSGETETETDLEERGPVDMAGSLPALQSRLHHCQRVHRDHIDRTGVGMGETEWTRGNRGAHRGPAEAQNTVHKVTPALDICIEATDIIIILTLKFIALHHKFFWVS